MRGLGAGIGLLGLLMGVALMFYLSFDESGTAKTSLDAKRHAEDVLNPISGRDAAGKRVTDSITFEVEAKGVRVKTVDPQGALAQQYGLIPNDLITEIGPLPAEQFATSHDVARDFMQAQYSRPDSWTIVRGTQRIKLPDQRNAGLAGAPIPGNPAAESPANPQRTNPRNQAMDLMKKIESH